LGKWHWKKSATCPHPLQCDDDDIDDDDVDDDDDHNGDFVSCFISGHFVVYI
jgi:hypothetical protein